MAGLLAATELNIFIDHRLFGLVDEDGQMGEHPAMPDGTGAVAANSTMLYVRTPDDVLNTRLRLEAWDGRAEFAPERWPVQGEAEMDLPSGRFLVDEIAAGGKNGVFTLPRPGRWRVRAAWRPGAAPYSGSSDDPEGWALVQFWPSL